MSKMKSSPARGLFSTSVVINVSGSGTTQKKHYAIMLDSQNTQTTHPTAPNPNPTMNQKKKGLLGSLFLKEPSGSAFAKAQAQHKLSTKAKSTASSVQNPRGTSIESNKDSLPTPFGGRLSISSKSTSSNSSKSWDVFYSKHQRTVMRITGGCMEWKISTIGRYRI
jgi:hypothetical protein